MIRDISRAKAELPQLIEEVLKGNEVIITKAGKPMAKLIPIQSSAKPRVAGSLAGKIQIAPGFGELPDDFAEAIQQTK